MQKHSLFKPVFKKPWPAEALIALIAFYSASVFNQPFFDALAQVHPWHEWADKFILLSTWLMIVALNFLLIALITPTRFLKPVGMIVLILSATSTYYIQQYHIYLDPSMARNILHTNFFEARELWSLRLWKYWVIWVIPAALIISLIPVKSENWKVGVQTRLIAISLSGLLAALLLFAHYKPLAVFLRNHHEARYWVTPGNLLWSFSQALHADAHALTQPRQPLGLDAKPGVRFSQHTRPFVVVWVVGETARAVNWGLNGYIRQTTPLLSRKPLIYFPSFTSCGTNTEVSVPCMFSSRGRHQYDEKLIRQTDSLLHLLNRAGVQVHWRDNQSGCKGVCDGLDYVHTRQSPVNHGCGQDGCWDEVLLTGLETSLGQTHGSEVWVLHQLGNHGPAYYRRYPPAFEQFKPACHDDDLSRCRPEEIINAYDNAILYTDFVMTQLINILQKNEASIDSVLIYVSDHGESLGEKNLYLHGMPYFIAPEEQTHVPMLMWFSSKAPQAVKVNTECLRRRAQQPANHDHLFHTVLSLLDIQTKSYDPQWDLLATCRT